MEVTEVKVFPVNEEKLKAFVSIVFDHCFMVNDIKVIRGRDGLFISMPSRRKKNGRFKDVSHPLNNETRQMIERLILAEYDKVTNPDAEAKEEETPGPKQRPDPEPESETESEAPSEIAAAAEDDADRSLEEVAELHLRDSFWNT